MKHPAKKSYADLVKAQIPKCLPAEKLGGHWRGGEKEYAHICKKLEYNFLDEQVPQSCTAKGTRFRKPIKYHRDACSLNSSQVMCICFFKKFFQCDSYEKLLLSALRQSGLDISEEDSITDAIFEYVPEPKEGTNFDFYLILLSGKHISFEIKYTEEQFGGIGAIPPDDPDKYVRKWDQVYAPLVQQSAYLSDREWGCTEFYQNYQINRNIVWAKEKDIAVFLTPRSNFSPALNQGRAYIDSLRNPNIVNLYWEDLVSVVLALSAHDTDLNSYILKFQDKYLNMDFEQENTL